MEHVRRSRDAFIVREGPLTSLQYNGRVKRSPFYHKDACQINFNQSSEEKVLACSNETPALLGGRKLYLDPLA
jgi:hypothetical protein